MCIYEDPDQDVNPFVLPGTGETLGQVHHRATIHKYHQERELLLGTMELPMEMVMLAMMRIITLVGHCEVCWI